MILGFKYSNSEVDHCFARLMLSPAPRYSLWRTFHQHKSAVNFATFSETGSMLLTGGDDGAANVWSVDDGVLLQSLPGSGYAIVCGQWIGNEELVYGCVNGIIHLFGIEKAKFRAIAAADAHDQAVESLAVSHNRIASTSNNEIAVWRLSAAGLQLVARYTAESMGDAGSVHFLDHNTILVTFVRDRCMIALEVTGETLIPVWEHSVSTRVGASALSPNSRYLAVWNLRDGVDVYSVQHGSCTHILEIKTPVNEDTIFRMHVSFAESGSLVIAGSDVGIIRIWRLHNGRLEQILQHQISLYSFRGLLAALMGKKSPSLVQTVTAHSTPQYHYIASAGSGNEPNPAVKIWRRPAQGPRDTNFWMMAVLLALAAVLALHFWPEIQQLNLLSLLERRGANAQARPSHNDIAVDRPSRNDVAAEHPSRKDEAAERPSRKDEAAGRPSRNDVTAERWRIVLPRRNDIGPE